MNSKKNNHDKKLTLERGGIQNLFEGIILCDAKGVIKQVNSVAEKILNSKINLEGKRIQSLLHKDDQKTFEDVFKKVLSKKGNSKTLIRRVRNGDGRYVWTESRLTNLLHIQTVAAIAVNLKDITEQKETAERQQEAQQGLLNSHNFLENVINTVAAPIFVKDKEHRWILFNNAFLRGREASSVVGKSDYDFVPKSLADKIWKVDNDVLRTGRTITAEELIPMDRGEVRTVITTKSCFVDDKGEKFIIGFIMDITERKRFEDLIKTINAQLRSVIESTKDQIVALDLRKNYTMFNRAHADTIGQLTGKEIKVGDNLLDVIPKELIPMANREIKKALKLGQAFAEVKLPNKTVLKAALNAIRDEKNRPTGITIFAEDITDRKLTEIKLRALNEELTQQNWQLASREEELKQALDQLSERNFELDQLMYKTSHDLRSPLSSILGLVNLANLDPEKNNLHGYLTMIEGRIKRLDEFINSMLNYGRVNRGEIKITRLDLRSVITGAIQQLENLDNYKRVKVQLKIRNEEIPFNNDALLINIIASNIISNAYKYYNPEAKSYLRINIEINSLSASLSFKDNGIGIQKEHMDKIFHMFYRATDRSQGSGLGMYIVKQAVEKVNGSIIIKSTYGEGTEIRIILPNL
ncbi:MAG TPA: PAS domain S-box protein [Cyclobacteriaceae bacterium]|nr:PAS domain S-box protein [Cyclobacteriaceae bacterium]